MEQDQPVIADDEYSELEQQEEGVAVMEEGPAGGSDGNDIFGNDFGGDPGADQGIFDDDAFK